MRSLSVAKQLAFHPLLVAARKTKLAAAVAEAAACCDQPGLRNELARLGNADVLKLASRLGIRDEHVVATPCLLRQRPSTLGYYRLLAGLSKKEFYRPATGFALLVSMEERNTLSPRQEDALADACRQLNRLLAELVLSLAQHFGPDDIRELPLLQLGAQLDGAHRNQIGEAAAQEVFKAVVGLLRPHITESTARSLRLIDSTKTAVTIRTGTDPDIEIIRDDGSARPRRIAIEIKGGTDLSNAHNRAGEAEKSHLKAKKKGSTDFWTIASLPPARLPDFKAQSPTTSTWFDLSEVLAREGPDWDEFRRQLTSAVGVPLS